MTSDAMPMPTDAPAAVPEPTVDTDEDPGALALALDAVLDEVSEALASGDVPTATALVTAAEATSDALLEVLGLADADDPGEP